MALLLKLLYYFFILPFVTCLKCLFNRRRSPPDFSSDIALVTGAGQGLGKQLAYRLSECGATVVLWDINEESVRSVCDELNEQGREAFAYRVDCSNREEIYAAADTVKKDVGNVSILVNNAGIYTNKLIADTDDEIFEKTMAVNFMAHYWTVKAFLPWMLKNDYGHIVSICSVSAFIGGNGGYGPSKAAVYNFCDGLRLELGLVKKNGISITCVCPWMIDTDMSKEIADSGLGNTGIFRFFPALKKELVANRVVEAIANKEFYVILPRRFSWIIWMKWIMPIGLDKDMMEATGMNKSLTNVMLKETKKTE